MEGVIENVSVKLTTEQNSKLSDQFREFYSLKLAPRVEKELFVSKSSHKRFIHTQMRERTPFESDKSFQKLESSAKSPQFDIISTKTSFKFPSGRSISLIEYLTEPNGLTKSVDLADSGGIALQFEPSDKCRNAYLAAEGEVLSRFISETGEFAK